MTRRLASASVDTDKRPAARHLMQEVLRKWQAGEQPCARAVLEGNPTMAQVKSVVIDLAYEEYCLRVEAGEPVDRDAFCAQFPRFQTSLCRRLEVHDFFDDDPEFPVVGQTVLGLRLLEELGRGALGRVFRAEEVALGNRQVAVKFAYKGQYEAEFLGRLRHPNVVPVYSVQYNEDLGLSAVVMPYLGDATLADLLDQGGLSVESVLRIVRQLADALAYTHRQGILHRDLKPTNVLVDPDGRPMLMDFNLSTDVKQDATRLGGTLLYMAPEQLAQVSENAEVAVDGRADVYSLGVMMWELLTGKSPVTKPLDLRRPSIPHGVRTVLRKCLAEAPEDRFQKADELEKSLRRQLRLWPRMTRLANRNRLRSAILATALGATIVTSAIAYVNLPSALQLAQQAFAAGRYDESAKLLVEMPVTAETQYMLGRARIGTGELDQAYENFKRSYELSGDGRSAACIAYVICLMTSNPPVAIDWHQRARAAGFDSPEMQNNDAYCHRRITKLPAARRLVEQALAAKPELETAILNLALIEMQEALSANQAVPVGVFDRALEKCPESYGLYMGAAAAVWKSDMKEPERSQRTIDYLRRALELGAKVDIVRPSFTSSTEGVPSLNGNPAFDALVTRTWNVTPVRPIYVSDPLGEFPSTRAGKYD